MQWIFRYCFSAPNKRSVESPADRGGSRLGREKARWGLPVGVERKIGSCDGICLPARRLGVDGVGEKENPWLPVCFCHGGCSNCLSESNGDQTGGPFDASDVSQRARGMSSGELDQVSTASPACPNHEKKRVPCGMGTPDRQKDGGRGVSTSGDGSNVRAS